MNKNTIELEYDFALLPVIPFGVYFLNVDGDIFPRQMFTVTAKRISDDGKNIEVHIMEIGRFLIYDPDTMTKENVLFPN